MLHKSESSSPVRDLDEGQAAAGAISDEGHRYYEQWLAAVHSRESEPPGAVYLHALQRAGNSGVFRYTKLKATRISSIFFAKYHLTFF